MYSNIPLQIIFILIDTGPDAVNTHNITTHCILTFEEGGLPVCMTMLVC